MKLLVSLFLATVLFISNTLTAQSKTIKATVINVTSDTGKVGFALYNKTTFMKNPLQSKKAKIIDGKSTVTFENLTPGVYAIVCYHDRNENDKMDFRENGMPLEDYGASNNVMNFGPPSFENAKFVVADKDVSLDIKF